MSLLYIIGVDTLVSPDELANCLLSRVAYKTCSFIEDGVECSCNGLRLKIIRCSLLRNEIDKDLFGVDTKITIGGIFRAENYVEAMEETDKILGSILKMGVDFAYYLNGDVPCMYRKSGDIALDNSDPVAERHYRELLEDLGLRCNVYRIV